MQNKQAEFFKELYEIQDMSINIMLSKAVKYHNLDEILTDVTYDIIYRIMELVDGYKNEKLSYEIIDRNSKMSINDEIELHNLCEEFLKCTDV